MNLLALKRELEREEREIQKMLLENKRYFHSEFKYLSDNFVNIKTNEVLGYDEVKKLKIDCVPYIGLEDVIIILKNGDEVHLEVL